MLKLLELLKLLVVVVEIIVGIVVDGDVEILVDLGLVSGCVFELNLWYI